MPTPKPETREEQVARCLKTMARDPEGLAEYVESHLDKPSQQRARLRGLILKALLEAR